MKNLNEELLRQLLLMNFDGNKTLLEQYELPKDVPSDRLGPKGDFKPLEPIKIRNQILNSFAAMTPKEQADKIYEIINIGGAAYGGGGFNFGRRFKKINKMMVVTFE